MAQIKPLEIKVRITWAYTAQVIQNYGILHSKPYPDDMELKTIAILCHRAYSSLIAPISLLAAQYTNNISCYRSRSLKLGLPVNQNSPQLRRGKKLLLYVIKHNIER